ncbi:hypothetical protein ABTZ93_05080 [Streptomyces sp. NPDC097941]|uniref:hypothetical protein n=1 Tax=Streptomyces sp. NPDC097941 TaxID=3155685 RepID=UPI0033192231
MLKIDDQERETVRFRSAGLARLDPTLPERRARKIVAVRELEEWVTRDPSQGYTHTVLTVIVMAAPHNGPPLRQLLIELGARSEDDVPIGDEDDD